MSLFSRMHTQLLLLISREWKRGVTECTCPELKCALSRWWKCSKGNKMAPKLHHPDSTAAAPHRAHLTKLPASTSDMVSLLTWMQIYGPPRASPAPLAWWCYHGNHCLDKSKREPWSIFLPGLAGHIHVAFLHMTNALHPKQPREERSAESGRQGEKMSVSLFPFCRICPFFPSLFIEALFFVLRLEWPFLVISASTSFWQQGWQWV